jgi:hypothetical protein
MNPFATDYRDVLFYLSSASDEIEKSLFDAYRNGLEAHKKLAQERLVDKTVSFYAPLKKHNLKNLCRYKEI